MSEPVSRRLFLRWLPALPALPAVLGQLGTGRFVTAQQGTSLAAGATRWSRQTYEVMLSGGRRLIEDVEWIVKNGETVAHSTIYKAIKR